MDHFWSMGCSGGTCTCSPGVVWLATSMLLAISATVGVSKAAEGYLSMPGLTYASNKLHG